MDGCPERIRICNIFDKKEEKCNAKLMVHFILIPVFQAKLIPLTSVMTAVFLPYLSRPYQALPFAFFCLLLSQPFVF